MHHLTSSALVATLATVLACGGDKKDAEPNSLSQFTSGLSQMEKAVKGMSESADRKPVTPVSYKVLLDYLPESLDDMKAAEPKGETGSYGEWQYSQAETNYRSEDGNKSAKVGLFDYAHIPMFYAPLQMMLNMNMNKESTEGYERSTKIGDFPAFEKWQKNGEQNEVTILVGDRFVVSTTTRGLGEGSAKKIAESIDLKDSAGKS
jgi:hypothetical protein